MVRVFVYGPGDLGSIPGRVITKTQKGYLMAPCITLSIIRCRSLVKWCNLGEGVAPSPTPWCCSYRKGNLWVPLDRSRQLYFYLLNDPIYTGAKLVCGKIGISQRNTNKNSKPGWEIRLGTQIKKLRQQ